jgi:hypothetical protein
MSGSRTSAQADARLCTADLASSRSVVPKDGTRSRAMKVEDAASAFLILFADRVQRVLLSAATSLRLSGHPAQPDCEHPEAVPGGRGTSEARLVRLRAHGHPARTARRPHGTGARPRRPARPATVDSALPPPRHTASCEQRLPPLAEHHFPRRDLDLWAPKVPSPANPTDTDGLGTEPEEP